MTCPTCGAETVSIRTLYLPAPPGESPRKVEGCKHCGVHSMHDMLLMQQKPGCRVKGMTNAYYDDISHRWPEPLVVNGQRVRGESNVVRMEPKKVFSGSLFDRRSSHAARD